MPICGPILDVERCMTTVTCIAAADFHPNAPDSDAESAGKISAGPKKFPRHVLVVDDEPLIRWSVAESLSDLGIDVEQASDAASALRIVSTTALPFDAVVLDLRLPDMDDLSLLGTLRQLLPDASLVLMTAFGTTELVADAQAMGVAVLSKPFELDDLKRLVAGIETDAA
jgi:DNA-binding NtrC family response regulator